MRDDRNVEMPLIVELSDDELEAVSAGQADINTLMQTLSNCLRMMSEMQKSIIANIRA